MAAEHATLARVLTPAGRGAVATIEVAGPHAESAVGLSFRAANGRDLTRQEIGRIVFGRWGTETGEEVVVCRRDPNVVEIHCHGGIAASAAIVEALVKAGCREESWADALLVEEADPIAAAARIALAEARTERTAAILLDQYRGVLRNAFNDIERLAASSLESDRSKAGTLIDRLLAFAPLGKHLTEPWQVVIAGQPNVGKSSLINALLGYGRAIVFDAPGTTRDVVTAVTAFDGWPVQLADTAGLRETADSLETAGVERAQQQLATADLIVLVHDGSQPWSAEDNQLRSRYPTAILVHNKADLKPSSEDPSRPAGTGTSALTGQGLAELQKAIVDRLVPKAPQPGEAVPFTREHIEQLRAWRT